MATRRTVLKWGIAVPAAAVASPGLAAFGSQGADVGVDLLLVDRTHAVASDLVSRYPHIAVVEMVGDLFSSWQSNLRDKLASRPIDLAGVTTGHAAFCLAEVARDFGYELTHATEYDPGAGLEPLANRRAELDALDLNRPALTLWALSRNGIAFRSSETNTVSG